MPVEAATEKTSAAEGEKRYLPLPIFKSEFVDALKKRLLRGDKDKGYAGKGVSYSQQDTIRSHNLVCPVSAKVRLLNSSDGADFQLKNAITVYRHFKNMTIMEATDARIWTYLAHVSFWDYMKDFRPPSKQPQSSQSKYILRHYFVSPVNSKNLLLNDISLLWWGAHLTHDPDHKADPFWLTAELFSMLDYTRHLLPGCQGRNRNFALAVMQYVAQNKEDFSSYKEAKVRFIMRKCNFIAGYKVFPILSRDEIIEVITSYKDEILKVKD